MRREFRWKGVVAAAVAALCSACGAGAPNAGEPPPGIPVSLQPPAQPFPQAALSEENQALLGALVMGFLVDATLRQSQELVPAVGWSDVIVPLQPQADYRSDVTLQAGRWYRFLGACDFECGNIDLELIDANGVVVVRDLFANDFPQMDFMSETGGVYTLRIMMRSCTIAPCYAGVRMVTQPDAP
jgi:hypothetical protein